MKKNVIKYLVGILVMIGVIGSSIISCGRKIGPADHAEKKIGLFVAPVSIETVTAQKEQLPMRFPIMGTAVSEEVVRLSARIPSQVTEVMVSSGEQVKKGQLLVSLDDREIREQLAAAEAQFKQADTEYERAKKLVDARASTDQALVAAESARNAARAQVDQATAVLSYARVLSPMDGTITERRVEVGDLAGPGQMLLSVYDPDRMRLECAVPVRLISCLPLGKEVDIRLDHPDRPMNGKVTEIVSEVDPISRTQKVKVRIQGETEDILPGSFGRLWVEGEAMDVIVVPSSAIYKVGQLEMLQILEGNQIKSRLIKTGTEWDGKIEILSGLSGDESVLVSPSKQKRGE